MKILAFDTSSSACSVALQHDEVVHTLHTIAPMQQTKLILPMIQEVLDTASLTLNQLDAIAYSCGPGSFTGIRIASSVAQGIGLAVGLPIIQISSLAAIAQTAFMERQWTTLLVALDARMDQIYWARYKINPAGLAEIAGQEVLCAPEAIPLDATIGPEVAAVGEGWEKYGDRITTRLGFSVPAMHSAQLPHARAILALAKVKFDQADWVSAACAAPTYLR
ncbi:MAG: tRNA (adenosine(37)-N6)-threonylcarbamoyltransferase complex dimerization subunit type 1 TsaB [Gammaproteobacteria bacterium]|nr:MAG: tRNA (adenosine(37)-N6)-threonylcarbamoyltransferase complex dimerization subunit type 1 TsaB [Gammaproteobacteria bacterium]